MNVRQRAESFHITLRQFQLFFLDIIKSFFLQIPDRCGQPHRTGCIYRSRLKFLRNRCENGSHAVRHLRDFLDRIHAAEHIRYLRNSHKTCSLINALLKRLICQLALTGTFQIMELRPSHTRHHLPRKQIAVMLHDCYSDLVAFL